MRVTAAIIIKSGKVLVARRKTGKKLAGFWEFPGGKLEANESASACLERELSEELGIQAVIGPELARHTHNYDFGCVELIALLVPNFTGELTPRDHDQLKWLEPSQLLEYPLAPADIPIAELLARRGLQEDGLSVKF